MRLNFSELLKIKYPKLFGLALTISLAYVVFSNIAVKEFVAHLNDFGYLGAFVAGLFFSFGFTSPFSAGFFITFEPKNILLAALLGGFGAMISDITIFKTIKISFMDEFLEIKKTKYFSKIRKLVYKNIGQKFKLYLSYVFAGIIIASPLPDEVGITFLAGLSEINIGVLALIGFILNTLGIFILLLI